ncbi:Uncharacterised protein [Cardiobacterium valvarum]|uniref:Uncharacterized protein n=1 Tax=Cardiobacterium valvarum TaxID=194702 RepID=A0A381E6C2_9GAMM|nr:Uncharacterised protein [Cardiobacterium valvarum]
MFYFIMHFEWNKLHTIWPTLRIMMPSITFYLLSSCKNIPQLIFIKLTFRNSAANNFIPKL